MKWSEFVVSCPKQAGPDREAAFLEAVRNRQHRAIDWSPIECAVGQHKARIWVSSDAVAIGDDQDWCRITANHTTSQKIADCFQAILPTTKISDLINAQAAFRILPCLQTPDALMASTPRMVAHHNEIERRRAGRTGLISTVGKDWVVTNRLVGRPDRAANYGWHDPAAPNRKCWQPLGLAHDRWHVDYSQTIRLVRRSMSVNSVDRDIVEVLRDPALCGLVSDEGPISLWRLAAVPIEDSLPPSVTPRTLRRGMQGEDVAEWQRTIGVPFTGVFDDRTEAVTRAWQASHHLVVDGVVGPKTRAAAQGAPPEPEAPIPFVKARNFTPVSKRKVSLVVLHTMEAAEKPTTAEAVASWFAGPNAPQASAHYCVDADSIVQCVLDHDVAWHAPGANSSGIGVEHAGYARQSPEDWADDYSEAMLRRSAGLVAGLCARHKIPVQSVDKDGLNAGNAGITTHAAVTAAFHKSTHTDPGPSFPMDHYLDLVRSQMS